MIYKDFFSDRIDNNQKQSKVNIEEENTENISKIAANSNLIEEIAMNNQNQKANYYDEEQNKGLRKGKSCRRGKVREKTLKFLINIT